MTALVCTFAATRAEAAADEPYRRAILLYGVAAVVELASEPLYLVASVRLAFSTRAAVDAVGTLARCVVTLVLVLRGSLPAATIFAVAQLCYAVVALVGYGMYGAHLARKRRLAWRLQRCVLLLILAPLKQLHSLLLASIVSFSLVPSLPS